MAYLEELDALQRWIKGVANLNSFRLSEAPPKVARPIILWEPPFRSRDRNLTRYQYVTRVQQYGKLYVQSLEQFGQLSDLLLFDIEEKVGVLPIYSAGAVAGRLKQVGIEFRQSEGLDVPFIITYEATYGRTKPEMPPPATYVGNRFEIHEKGQ